MIEFTKDDKDQLQSVVFKTVLKKTKRPGGKSLAAFWDVARCIGDKMHTDRQRWFNLRYERQWETVSEYEYGPKKGDAAIERCRWSVWAYNYDHLKDAPFATDEGSETLLFSDLLIDEDDLTYWYLQDYEEDY